MLRKGWIIALATVICSAPLCAEQLQVSKESPARLGGWVTGLSGSTLAFGGGLANIGYYGLDGLFDIGMNYSHYWGGNVVSLIGHLGLRNRLFQNLFIDYGAMGAGYFPEVRNEWAVGAFVGLDYQLSEHFMLLGKVYPYGYRHDEVHQVFANTTLSLYYVY